MKRKIIEINEDLCNGCGDCVTGCEEGALKIINGKAKLVRDDFCDGFGDCIGHCSTGALTIIEREADDFDEKAVKEAQKKQRQHHHHHHHHGGGCPGSRERVLKKDHTPLKAKTSQNQFENEIMPSELRQWPVQLHLVNPKSNIFDHREMVILSTCSPITSPDTHWKYIRGRSVVVACPKLDDTGPYVEKLAQIFKNTTIPMAIVVVMEVPCCGGLAQMAMAAHEQSDREDLNLEIHVMSLEGKIIRIIKG